jgi:hypothetical protein
VPQSRSLIVLSAALCQQRQLAARLSVMLFGQAEIDGLRAGRMGALRIAAPLQIAGKPEEIQALEIAAFFGCEQRIDLAH